MKIDRDVERFCTFEDWPEEFIVQIAALNMAVDHGSLKEAVKDRALQLGDRGLRIGIRQGRKCGKAGGIGPDCLRDTIVGLPGNCSRRSRIELLRSRRGKRQ